MDGQAPFVSTVCRSGLQSLKGLVIVLPILASRLPAAETFTLTPASPDGSATNVEVVMQVGGDLLLNNLDQPATSAPSVRKLPMSVAAKLVYDEMPCQAVSTTQPSLRTARQYHGAKALVEIDKGKQSPTLSAEHRAIVVEWSDAEVTLAGPTGPLTREELDLIDVPANPADIAALLPTKPASLGDSWKHDDRVVASLLRLDAISLGDVQSMLAEVDTKANQAKLSLAGTVHGAVGGVATEIELKAKYTVDLQTKRVTLFAMLVKEKRSIGHVGPGLDVVAKQIVKMKPVDASESLQSLARLANRPLDESAKNLLFVSTANEYRLLHDRRWFPTSDDKRLSVFRMVDRGELIAQCNIATLGPVPAGKTFQLADFQGDIEKSLGKKFGQFVAAKEETDGAGRRVFRVVATGNVSELPIQWVYYLFTSPDGRRLSVAFTMEQSLVERFGQADRQFVSAVEILPTDRAAGVPTPAKR